MSSYKELARLLEPISDIEQEAYALVKQKIKEGIDISAPEYFKQGLIRWEAVGGQKHVPIVFDAISSLLYISKGNSNNEIRTKCHKIIVFDDETIEIDLTLIPSNVSWGKKYIKLDQINYEQLHMGQFFVQKLKNSDNVKLTIRLLEFGKKRIKHELNSSIFDTNEYSQKIYKELLVKLNNHIGTRLSLPQGINKNPPQDSFVKLLKERFSLWGISNDDLDLNKNLNNLFFNYFSQEDVVNYREVCFKFLKEDLNNEELLKKSTTSDNYIKRVEELINQIKE